MPSASSPDTITAGVVSAVGVATLASDHSGVGVVAFPPVAKDVAAIAYDVEHLPVAECLRFARNMVSLATTRDDPACATTNLHATFAAMLALCRVLDAVDYPWDLVDRRRARA